MLRVSAVRTLDCILRWRLYSRFSFSEDFRLASLSLSRVSVSLQFSSSRPHAKRKAKTRRRASALQENASLRIRVHLGRRGREPVSIVVCPLHVLQASTSPELTSSLRTKLFGAENEDTPTLCLLQRHTAKKQTTCLFRPYARVLCELELEFCWLHAEQKSLLPRSSSSSSSSSPESSSSSSSSSSCCRSRRELPLGFRDFKEEKFLALPVLLLLLTRFTAASRSLTPARNPSLAFSSVLSPCRLFVALVSPVILAGARSPPRFLLLRIFFYLSSALCLSFASFWLSRQKKELGSLRASVFFGVLVCLSSSR